MNTNSSFPSFRRLLPVLFIVLFLVALMGCSSVSGESSPPDSSQAASGNSVDINKSSFSQPNLTVKVGTTVTWTNRASDVRFVASDNYVFTSYPLEKGKSYSYTFDKAGTFPLHCTTQGSINVTLFKGTVIVEP
jgi:plastocyanin